MTDNQQTRFCRLALMDLACRDKSQDVFQTPLRCCDLTKCPPWWLAMGMSLSWEAYPSNRSHPNMLRVAFSDADSSSRSKAS
ncbi:hypothetical protein I7I48_01519 [Histoplasma ohiense]|nr:hypothetical protein I7I48_01519 [Histoplasma ohiense (nom. inval.)]